MTKKKLTRETFLEWVNTQKPLAGLTKFLKISQLYEWLGYKLPKKPIGTKIIRAEGETFVHRKAAYCGHRGYGKRFYRWYVNVFKPFLSQNKDLIYDCRKYGYDIHVDYFGQYFYIIKKWS